jgi:hypothetical protein
MATRTGISLKKVAYRNEKQMSNFGIKVKLRLPDHRASILSYHLLLFFSNKTIDHVALINGYCILLSNIPLKGYCLPAA